MSVFDNLFVLWSSSLRADSILDAFRLSMLDFPDADRRADVFGARYNVLHQRTARHKLFSRPVAGSELAAAASPSSADHSGAARYKLKTVDFLLGTGSKLNNIIVLGMLTQAKYGVWSLEDPTGTIRMDLTEAKFHHGLYTENCFALVEGWYEDQVLHVVALGHPPAETAKAFLAVFGGAHNLFGGPLEVAPRASKELVQLERTSPDTENSMFVFLSDVWLDRAGVVDRLARMLAGFASADVIPTAFVLMGNFMSAAPQHVSGGYHAAATAQRDLFKVLGEVLAEHPDLLGRSKFVFVPGPNDPAYPNVLPRPELPPFVQEGLFQAEGAKKVASALRKACVFATNPCRIQYCSQEIVVLREDVVSKVCRNCLYMPPDHGDGGGDVDGGDVDGGSSSSSTNSNQKLASHFARTVVAQAHLVPLPFPVSPVHWDYDRSLWLYPPPDLVVYGDKFSPFTAEHVGCTVVNPGSFVTNDFSFKTYLPRTRQVEDSQIPSAD